MATQAELDAAKKAYHALMTGRGVQAVTIDGVTTTYTPADRGALKAYIETLEAQLGVTTSATRRRPAGVY